MSNIANLFIGLDRDQARKLQTLAMPTLWALREAIETDETTLKVDLSQVVAPPQRVKIKDRKGVQNHEQEATASQ